mgnify:CR=1 FL=1
MNRPNQGFSDRVARAMARHHAETGQRLLPGPDGDGKAAGDAPGKPKPLHSFGQVVVPAAPAFAVDGGFVPVEAGVVNSGAMHPEAIDLLEQSRRRRVRRRALFVFICLLLVALAFVPVANNLVLPATVVAYGEEAIVVSPASGTIKQTLIGPGDRVKRGQRLLLIEPPPSVTLIAARRDWNALKIKEARLAAQISGRDSFPMPDGLFSLEIGPDPDSVLHEQRL